MSGMSHKVNCHLLTFTSFIHRWLPQSYIVAMVFCDVYQLSGFGSLALGMEPSNGDEMANWRVVYS